MKLTRNLLVSSVPKIRMSVCALSLLAVSLCPAPLRAACSFESPIELRTERESFRDDRTAVRERAVQAEQAARAAFRDFRTELRHGSEVRIPRCVLETVVGDPRRRPLRAGEKKSGEGEEAGLEKPVDCDATSFGLQPGIWVIFEDNFEEAFLNARRMVWPTINGPVSTDGPALLAEVSKFRAGLLPPAQRSAIAKAAILHELQLAIERQYERYSDGYRARECLSRHQSEVIRVGNALPFAKADLGTNYVRNNPLARQGSCGNVVIAYDESDWSRNAHLFAPIPQGYAPLVEFMEDLRTAFHELRASHDLVGTETWPGLKNAILSNRPLHLQLADNDVDQFGAVLPRTNLDKMNMLLADFVATHNSGVRGQERSNIFSQLLWNWFCEVQFMRDVTERNDRIYFRDARIRTVFTDTNGIFHRNLTNLIKTWTDYQVVAAKELTRLKRILDTLP